jgi:SynChlorMet cassette radical SAM/SPASM protein ScmF
MPENASEAPPPLRSVYLYLTNECNQHCIHCWINPALEGRSRGEKPALDNYRRFLDAAVHLGANFVKITGGEPLLREETFPLIEHVSRAGARAAVETNAMLVGHREAAAFQKHRVSVSVSLDGATAAVHDRRRGLPGAFERTWRAVKLMTSLKIPLTIVTAVSRSNRDEIRKVLELLRSLASEAPLILKINPIVALGRARALARQGDTLGPGELLDLVNEVCNDLRPWYQEHGIEIVLQLELAFFPIDSLLQGAGQAGVYHCGFLNLLSILADGSITFCGIGYEAPQLTMGNIRGDYDLPSLWSEHPILRQVRFNVRHALEGVCGDCLLQGVCLGGCRASALAMGGSLTASPPLCQSLYDAGLFAASRLREPAASRYAAIVSGLGA